MPPVDPFAQLAFDVGPQARLAARKGEDLRPVTQLEVELKVTLVRGAKHETFTHELHAGHDTGSAATC